MKKIWVDAIIDWKQPKTWIAKISLWLRPHLNERGIRYLQEMDEKDLFWDDSEWLKIFCDIIRSDIESVIDLLAEDLSFSVARTYHSCRTQDAGIYHQMGIRRNDPAVLADEVRRIVREEEDLGYLQAIIEERLENFKDKERDTGKLYLVLDDRSLINSAGHYLLYGSEWIQCVLGWEAHGTLRKRGTPTIIVVNLPLDIATIREKRELAEALLQEWTRIKINKPDWVPEKDFSFCLRSDIPSSAIICHIHPKEAVDPFYGNIMRSISQRKCPSCN